MAPQLTALIMAAGHGTRMRSDTPKVLHPVCGVPMLHWVIEAATDAGATDVVCITRHEAVNDALPSTATSVDQGDGEGTGSAIAAARAQIDKSDRVLILSGDVPLISSELIAQLLATHEDQGAAATLLTTDAIDPAGYGRIVKSEDGSVDRVVETKQTDGVPQEILDIRWINVGAYVFDAQALMEALDEVQTEPNGERYLTNVFPILREKGRKIAAHQTHDTLSSMGVNDRVDLAEVTALARKQLIEEHARNGVTFLLPDTVEIDKRVTIGRDTTIAGNVALRGATTIGSGTTIGPGTTIESSAVGDSVSITNSVIVEATIADNAAIGPFAYLRPEADIREGAKVGTFVEVKKSTIHEGAKVPHLSYIGDADIGNRANLGAGTITANYHRGRKTRTTVGEDVHTGVHTALVAPVNVGAEAYTGAGSVITEDVPEGALAVSHPRDSQNNIEGYADRVKQEPQS
jgi:bifunctional UDP-N-acetylglucosamine pyrophosphorylase / glucosamine-1-phosphate N-acetyltransferase